MREKFTSVLEFDFFISSVRTDARFQRVCSGNLVRQSRRLINAAANRFAGGMRGKPSKLRSQSKSIVPPILPSTRRVRG